MKPIALLRACLAIIAVIGVVLSPIIGPAVAAPSAAKAHMARYVAAELAECEDCCPELPAVPDCVKTCSLLANCLTSGLQYLPTTVALYAPVPTAQIAFSIRDAGLKKLSRPPPTEPPRT